MHKQMLLLWLCVISMSGCARIIEDGQAGVKFDLGRISKQPLTSGMKFYAPFFSKIEVWNIKTMEIKETANVPSSEGLISTLDVSVLFRVPIDQVVDVRTNVGQRFIDILLIPNIRDSIRNVVSGYPVKALFSDSGRTEIASKIFSRLRDKMASRGIVIEDVLLRDVRLPPTFAKSIESKLRAEQESLQKEFELEKAKKDAEIEIERAKGVAQSNQIIANSLSENYLRYRWIDGLQSNNMQVIYVPTEANLPILEARRLESAQSQAP
jgi:prohibitin 1